MLNTPDFSEQNKITWLSSVVSSVYLKYKSKIEEIIYNNYWTSKERDLLELFKELWIVLSDRNDELLRFLETQYWLDFKSSFDFSWWIRFNSTLLTDNLPENVRKFYSKKYTRQEWSKIHSRWYWYYFNLEGFNLEWNNYKLDIDEYSRSLWNYYTDIQAYLHEFNWKNINDLDESSKKLLLVWLEHYKNILLFLQNLITSISNKEYLTEHILNVSSKNFEIYFEDVSKDTDYSLLNDTIKKEIERVIDDFWDITIWIRSNREIIYEDNDIMTRLMPIFIKLYKWSFQKQHACIEKLKNKSKNWKEPDIESISKSLNRWNNKLVGKLLRIIREEDNPIKQLFACHNIAQNIPKEVKKVDSVGILYGWIEMPYFMKYILKRFKWIESDNVKVEHMWLSVYSNRNLKQTSVLNNYRPIKWWDNDESESRLQLILDDNVFYWMSLQVANNIWSAKWPTYSWVAEIWLRRWLIWKLNEWPNINHLLSKVSDSASVTPIEKNKWSYRNLVSKYLLKKLPGLVGNL